jgi:hypothetical protein
MSTNIERVCTDLIKQIGLPIHNAPKKFYSHNKTIGEHDKIFGHEYDCISCQKGRLGHIPNQKKCRLICG